MRTTIDRAGRAVIAKAVRDRAGLEAGTQIEVQFRDGRIELEPASAPKRLVTRGTGVAIEAEQGRARDAGP